MEKHSYDTYEFLNTNNTNTDASQFFVMQDGTILTVNKEIQYITQVQEEKEAIEDGNQTECAVFNVSSQQYYVDVEGSTPEMISINDQFAISSEGSNVYTNAYLIQSETNTPAEQMDTSLIDPQTLDAHQLQQQNVEAYNGNKQTSNMTEITLSDEQYQILEQKGWLMLESNNRMFVLNTLGLHDITANEKLIKKLKNELQETETNTNTNIGLKEEVQSTLSLEKPAAVEPTSDLVDYFIAKNEPMTHDDSDDNIQYIINENIGDENISEDTPVETKSENAEEPLSASKIIVKADQENDSQKKCDAIKIKTKYTFTDIPEKIFLGKTANGKKLYAKVTKKYVSGNKAEQKKTGDSIIYGKTIDMNHPFTGLDGQRFLNLIQSLFRDNVSKVNPMTITVASQIIAQLMRFPNIRDSIIGSNLVLTMVTTCNSDNVQEVSEPTMVTGTVKQELGNNCFIHMPQMLHSLVDKYCGKEEPKILNNMVSSTDTPEGSTKGIVDLFHIHVSETRNSGVVPTKTSINLCKRKLPLNVLKESKKRHLNPVYACGTCGSVFKSESALKDHQNAECTEVEDELTIDTDYLNTNNETLYSVAMDGKDKIYACLICDTKFKRMFNCQKHIMAHKTGVEKKLKVYKCKMCPNTYFHSSSLSKHILKMHIQTQLN